MEVNSHFFTKEVLRKAKNTGGINPGDAIKITRKEYCVRMYNQWLCTEHCEDCLSELRRHIELGEANSPRALYIYRLRDAVARKVDEKKERCEQELRNTNRISSGKSFAEVIDELISQLDDKSNTGY